MVSLSYFPTKLSSDRDANDLPPESVEAEEAILGACLLDASAYRRITDIITTSDAFFVSIHRIIWKAIVAISKRGTHADLMVMTSYLFDHKKLDDIGGQNKLAQLVERTVSSANVDIYAKLLMQKYKQRQLISFGHEMIQWGHEQKISPDHLPEIFERAKNRLSDITDFPVGETPIERRRKQYEQKIKEIENYLLNVDDIGFRQELLDDLARKYGTSTSKLIALYYKSLIGVNNGKSLTFRELREQYGNDVTEWVLHGLLPRGSATMVHASGGLGKSLLMYDLTFHMLFGMDWNEFSVTRRQKGLIIQTDEAQSDLINHLTARGFTEDLDFKVKTDWSIEYLPQLYKEIQEENYDWVTIDSLTSVSRNSCIDENGMEYAMPVLQLNNIASKTNTHILLLHHSNKSDGSARGSSAIRAAVSQVIKLDVDKDSSDDCLRVMTFTKSRSRCPGAYKIRLHADEEPGRSRNYWELVGEVRGIGGQDPHADWKTRIKNFLKENCNSFFYARDICDAIRGKWNTIRTCLTKLASSGEIGRKERLGKANLYFLGSPKIPDRPATNPDLDRENDRPLDRVSESEPEPTTAEPDREIAKNEEIIPDEVAENSRSTIAVEVNINEDNGSEGDLNPDRHAIATSEGDPDTKEENITAIVDELRSCENLETLNAIANMADAVSIVLLKESILCDPWKEAMARLSPEERDRIEQIQNPPKPWDAPTNLKKGERVIAPENPDWGVGIVQKVYELPDIGLQVHVKWKDIKEDFPVSIIGLYREGEEHQMVEPAPTPESQEESEETEREQAIEDLIEKIEACRSITDWEKLAEKTDSELLAIARERCTPIKKLQIEKWLRQEEEERKELERELNHVNPFSVGDRVVLLGSACRGLGEISRTHRNQCLVQFASEESAHYDHSLVKVGQKVRYAGDDENLKKTFAHPKVGKKYRSLFLTVNGLKEEAKSVKVELTHEKWAASFWVDLSDVKR